MSSVHASTNQHLCIVYVNRSTDVPWIVSMQVFMRILIITCTVDCASAFWHIIIAACALLTHHVGSNGLSVCMLTCNVLVRIWIFVQNRSYWNFLGSYLQKRGVIHQGRKLRNKPIRRANEFNACILECTEYTNPKYFNHKLCNHCITRIKVIEHLSV